MSRYKLAMAGDIKKIYLKKGGGKNLPEVLSEGHSRCIVFSL